MKNQFGLTLTLFIFLIGCIHLDAQDSLKIRILTEAQQYFNEKDFVKALPLYRELLKSYPKEPEYRYCVGVCLFKLNQEPDEAISLLRWASLSNYDPMIWYYLGRVLHLNYSFDEAIKAYSKFLLVGKNADIKSLEVERLIEMAKNGIDLTRTGHAVNVMNTRTIQTEQMPLAAEINGSGKLMMKPLEFCTRPDLKAGFRPWIFLPAYTQLNEYIYSAGYVKAGKNQKQLFRIKNINHVTWGTPEPLDITINTPYDEEYPYFDSKSSVLYFCSKGHSSMGGYDIFRSMYDWNTKTWSKPENMGFPINSPYDDFLFITDEFGHSASFVSNRSTGPGEINVYRIKLEQDTTGIRFSNVDEIRKASELNIESPEKDSKTATLDTRAPQPDFSEQAETAPFPVELPVTAKTDYNKVLAEALSLQIKADSLSRLTRDKRIIARDTPDDELKKQLVTEIIRSDKEAKSCQREADLKFNEARKIKTPEETEVSRPDSSITLAKEINGIRVYQYKTEILPEQPEDTPVLPAVIPPSSNEKENIKPAETDEFAIQEKSPYDASNPIPRGLGIHPGLVYRIQLGVFSKIKAFDAFGGIWPINYEQVTGSNIIKYFAGLFHSINTVTSALEIIRSMGYPDAFVVAFFDGKMISTEKAREIEFAGFRL